MITEKGKLLIGVEWPENSGHFHRDFEIRPQLVRDTIEALEDEKRDNKAYLGLLLLTKQIMKLGDIPPDQINTNLLLNIHQIDLAEINDADGRLGIKLNSFRGADKGPEKRNPDVTEDRIQQD